MVHRGAGAARGRNGCHSAQRLSDALIDGQQTYAIDAARQGVVVPLSSRKHRREALPRRPEEALPRLRGDGRPREPVLQPQRRPSGSAALLIGRSCCSHTAARRLSASYVNEECTRRDAGRLVGDVQAGRPGLRAVPAERPSWRRVLDLAKFEATGLRFVDEAASLSVAPIPSAGA